MDHTDHGEPSLFKEIKVVAEEESQVKGGGGEREGSSNDEARKSCTDCKTTKTPLWRSGPAGPKSLCNACGIRYRKRRGPLVGPGGTISPIKTGERAHYTDDSSSGGSVGGSLRVRFMVMGKKVILQRPRPIRPNPSPPPPPSSTSCSSSPPPVAVKKQRCQRRRKLRLKEEEMAAFSLMALSCGSVFA